MKTKLLSLLLVMAMALTVLAGCGSQTSSETSAASAASSGTEAAAEAAGSVVADATSEAHGPSSAAAPAWEDYDALISTIYQETDLAAREAEMHQAEDMLMDTWAVVPLYYYNDVYLQSTDVDGIYCNLFGYKYFAFATAPNNTMAVNIASEPAKLDPALNSSVDGACLAILSFSGLYAYNEDGELVPELAESYELSDDGLTYTFTLRDGLKWSDGTDLGASDIVYSWNRLADPNTGADYSYLVESANIATKDDGTLDVTASDDNKTLTVVLSRPCAYFLDLCAFPAFYPVPQQDVESADDYENNPGAWAVEAGFVTSGPFTLTSWTHNESMTYEKNPNYWNADAVSLESIDFMLSADDTAVYNAFNDGSLQFADSIPSDEMATASQTPEFHKIPNLGTYYVGFNVNSSMFDGLTVQQAKDVRHALCILIDRQYIVDTIAQADQEVANTFIPTGMADGQGGEFRVNDDAYTYPDEEHVGYYDPTTTDVDTARTLLEGAGYKFKDDGTLSDETPLNLTYLTNDGDAHVKIAQAMQQDFAVLGITMDIESKDWEVVLSERKEGQFDVAREGWLADYNDPINMLEMWLSDGGNNDMQFGR